MTKPVVIIGGPTASGKSGLALAVAAARSSVIINADSMQVYDGLPLLTAQPSPGDKTDIEHRLYGILSPDDICTAARWRQMALDEINRAHDMGKLPVIVGGTGFYIKVLTEGISPIPEVDSDIRARGIALQQEIGNPAFHEMLKARDPATAATLDPLNTQRNVRAWEVLEGTGKGLAEWHKVAPDPAPAHLDFKMFALLPPRDALYRNCDARFVQIVDAGGLDEAKTFKETRTAPSSLDKALGYPELSDYLDGKISLEDAITAAQQSTRNYAKRQTTWFKNQMPRASVLDSADAAPILNSL